MLKFLFFQICLKRGKSFCETRQSWVEAEEGGMEGVGGILLQLIILTGLLGSGERDKQVFDLRSLNSKVKSSFRHFTENFPSLPATHVESDRQGNLGGKQSLHAARFKRQPK